MVGCAAAVRIALVYVKTRWNKIEKGGWVGWWAGCVVVRHMW